MKRDKSKDPKPVLKSGAVYFADNGRAICRKCAGASALYTGRDISGQPVERMTLDDARWLLSKHVPIACESGCTTLAAISGPDGWPAEMVREDEHTITIEIAG